MIHQKTCENTFVTSTIVLELREVVVAGDPELKPRPPFVDVCPKTSGRLFISPRQRFKVAWKDLVTAFEVLDKGASGFLGAVQLRERLASIDTRCQDRIREGQCVVTQGVSEELILARLAIVFRPAADT